MNALNKNMKVASFNVNKKNRTKKLKQLIS